MNLETKHLALEAASFKFDAETGVIEGYGSTFNGVDAYKDTVVPGAYKNTLKDRKRPIQMRFNHHSNVVGKWTEAREDEKGLFLKGQLTPGHSLANDVLASLKHEAIDGLSIGYRVKDFELKGGIRYLKEIELVEVSIVETPADLDARITNVKTADAIEACETLKELEDVLRDSGFSKKAATALVSRVRTLGDPVNPLSEFADAIQRIPV